MTTLRSHANVLGVHVAALDMDHAIRLIRAELKARRKGYVCMANVFGIMEAHRNADLAAIYASSCMNLPDGAPTVWVGRLQGHKRMQRIAGPELMLEVFRRKEFARYKHFLYGGECNVADQLRDRLTRRYPWARIVGTYSPPFRELNADEELFLIRRVREASPDIFWVGISTPKQERFMRRFLPLLDTTMMFGVGAAYDFHTGRIHDAPQWIKTIGMQWMHRLAQDPRRLWKRYLRNNPPFLMHIALQLSGIRAYPPMVSIAGELDAMKPSVISLSEAASAPGLQRSEG